MPGFETSDLIIVLVIVLVLFWLKRLPQLGSGTNKETKGLIQKENSQEDDT